MHKEIHLNYLLKYSRNGQDFDCPIKKVPSSFPSVGAVNTNLK